MQGFYIGSKDTCIDKVAKKTEELSLLARGGGAEIMLQKIEADKLIVIDPGEDAELMEFFYILEGSLICEESSSSRVLNKGDYFYVHHLKATVSLRTISEVTMLYVCTQPLFHLLSNEIKELMEMSMKVEEKDMYTNDHCNRIGDYGVKVAKRLGLSPAQLEKVYYTALLHDIGKVFVPDHILNKPGKLTPEEFEFIKKHPEDGQKIVSKTFLADVGHVIAQHHERPDGSGYPHGLKGDEICIEAKIIAAIDSFDAMTTDRPYRKAMKVEAALEELKSLIGKQYDGNVIKVFEEVLRQEGII